MSGPDFTRDELSSLYKVLDEFVDVLTSDTPCAPTSESREVLVKRAEALQAKVMTLLYPA